MAIFDKWIGRRKKEQVAECRKNKQQFVQACATRMTNELKRVTTKEKGNFFKFEQTLNKC